MLTFGEIIKGTVWIAKTKDGKIKRGTSDELSSWVGSNEIETFDLCAVQPEPLREFYDKYFAFEDDIAINEFYEKHFVKK